MSTHITHFRDVSGIGADFDSGTLCGHADLERFNGTPKCFTINSLPGRPGGMIVMPKMQALILAGQIAQQFGFILTREK
jgi:hypothetical protein